MTSHAHIPTELIEVIKEAVRDAYVRPVWMTVRQASEYQGVTPRTVKSWFKHGLPYSKLPSGTIMIETAALDNWLRSFAVSLTSEGAKQAYGVSEKDREIVEEIIDGLK